jgi:hypothetical protein
MPWNRPTSDSVVNLDPDGDGERFEMRGRLVAPDGVSPMAGLRVYAYHADRRYGYADPKYPDIDLRGGVLLTGPAGGYCIRSTIPAPYSGPPHLHMDAAIPGRGRCSWVVQFYPDSASWPLPGETSPSPKANPTSERRAVLHRGPDGVFRANRILHIEEWHPDRAIDSVRAAIAHRFERAPWRTGPPAKAQVPH